MNINRRIMQIGVALMVLTIIGSIIYINYMRLKKPVFLRCCIEMEVQTNISDTPVLQLQYITNVDDDRKVIGMTFKEARDLFFNATENFQPLSGHYFYNLNANQLSGTKIGRYCLHSVYVSLDNVKKVKDEMELNHARIHFSDGTTMNADLGKIILYREAYKEGAVVQKSGYASSNNTSGSSYQIDDDITLIKIESKILNDAPKFIELKIDGINYDKISEKQYSKGDTLNISSAFHENQTKGSNYDAYDIMPRLIYRNSDKTTDYIRIYNINWQRSLVKYKDILSYLNERGAF